MTFSCPICHVQLQLAASAPGESPMKILSQHIETSHKSEPCFIASNNARPWRCPLCTGRKPCYATPASFAKHIMQTHQASSGSATTSNTSILLSSAVDSTSTASSTGTMLKVPCLPWLPRPKCCLRIPQATVLLATWNLEVFSLNTTDSGVAEQKVSNICETIQQLCREEGAGASVVIALQEVVCPNAVPFLTRRLNEIEDAAAAGGGSRTWHCVTSRPLGHNSERAAFLWSGPPSTSSSAAGQSGADDPDGAASAPGCGLFSSAGGGGGAGKGAAGAPLFADAATSFQLLTKEDLEKVLRTRKDEQLEGRFLRSPFYGLFRVGYANLLLVNVHLAADAPASRAELTALPRLATAIHRTNPRLFRRHSLHGFVRGRRPRGVVAVLGDFNCPMGRAVSVCTPSRPSTVATSRASGASGTGACTLNQPSGTTLAGTSEASGANGSGPGFSTPKRASTSAVSDVSAASGAGPVAEGRVKGEDKRASVASTSEIEEGAREAAGRSANGDGGGGGGEEQEARRQGQGQGKRRSSKKNTEEGAGDNGKSPGKAKESGGRASGTSEGGGEAANRASWEAFQASGWINVLTETTTDQGSHHPPTRPTPKDKGNVKAAADAPAPSCVTPLTPLATNWRAKRLQALDAICLPSGNVGLVTGRGVRAPPVHVCRITEGPCAYPNHLIAWVRLDLGPLQRAPGKVRGLEAPAQVAVASGAG